MQSLLTFPNTRVPVISLLYAWVCVGSYSFSHSWWLSISHWAYDCSNKTHEFWSSEDLRDELIWGFVSSSKQWAKANEMAQMLKTLIVKADHPSSTSKTHVVGENWLLQDGHWCAHTHALCVLPHSSPPWTHTKQTNNVKKPEPSWWFRLYL